MQMFSQRACGKLNVGMLLNPDTRAFIACLERMLSYRRINGRILTEDRPNIHGQVL